MTDLPPEELLVHTLDLLEHRLRRIEYLFNGGDLPHKKPRDGLTASLRLHKLQNALGQLAAKSSTVEQLLRLQAQHPSLFEKETPSGGEEPDSEEKLALVLSEAPTYLALASQLRALQDVTLPPTTTFAELVAAQPRFGALMARQEEQAREIAELRVRSALLVSRWYEVQILGLGRCWAEWEGRLRDVERGVRRVEVAREVD